MKTKLLLVSTMLLALSQVFGQTNVTKGQTLRSLPIYESFDYTVGENLCKAGGISTPLNGQWASPVDNGFDDKIIDSSIWATTGIPSYSGNALYIQGGNTDPQVLFPTTDSGSIYLSFLCKINDFDGLTTTTAERFIGLGQPHSVNNASNSTASLYFNKLSSTTFKLGMTRASTPADVDWIATTYTFGTEFFIVIRYDIDLTNSTAHVYIFPAGSGSVPAIQPITATKTTQMGTSRNSVNAVLIRQNSTSTTPEVIIDELRVGTTWNTGTGIPLSVSKNDVSGLKIYPNPVSNGIVYINSNSTETKYITVFDVLGKQVIQKEVSNGALDVSSLRKGIYMMQVTEGSASSTKKLIIE